MSLNNYKLKNIHLGKIEICPIYKSVIDIDDIDFIKTNYDSTELEAMNFLNPVSVYQTKESHIIISGLITLFAFKNTGSSIIKARVVTKISKQEVTLCVLHDIITLTRMIPLTAKRRNRLKDQLYTFVQHNKEAVQAFSLLNGSLTSFSKVLMYFDSSYRSSHFEHKKQNIHKSTFKLSGKWFSFDAENLCFEIKNGEISGLYSEKNSYSQKLIFEQRTDKTYDVRGDYSADRYLFRFRIMQSVVHLANIGNSLIYFDDAEKTAIEIVIGHQKTENIRLEAQPRSKGFFLTEKNTVKYLIDTTDKNHIIRTQNSNNAVKMKKCNSAVLPVG